MAKSAAPRPLAEGWLPSFATRRRPRQDATWRDSVKRRRDSLREAADASGDFRSYRVQRIPDFLPVRYREAYEVLTSRSGALFLLTEYETGFARDPEEFDRGTSSVPYAQAVSTYWTAYFIPREQYSEFFRAGVPPLAESCDALGLPFGGSPFFSAVGMIEFAHGLGWDPPPGLPYHADRYLPETFDPGTDAFDEVFSDPVRIPSRGRSGWIDPEFDVPNYRDPAFLVSELDATLAAAAHALDAVLDGALANIRRSPTDRFERDYGLHVQAFERIRSRVLMDLYEDAGASDASATVAVPAFPETNGEADTAPSSGIPGVEFSDDFGSVNWYGERYTFTPPQAAIIEALYEAHRKGYVGVGRDRLLEIVECQSGRVDAIFASRKDAWKAMIVSEGRPAVYRLAVRDEAQDR